METNSLDTKSFISNQNVYKKIPYGKKGTVSGNGCGSIACYNFLLHSGYDISYLDAYKFFNRRSSLIFNGKLGTNPFAVKQYLKNTYDFKVKMHFFHVPKKSLKSCIILYIYKYKKRVSAHYMFGYIKDGKLKTYNLDSEYTSIKDCIKEENTIGRLYVVYEIKKKY